MKVEIGILQDGDEVLGMWENRILVKHKSGEAEFFVIEVDENGMPRLSSHSWLITYGNREIKITDERKSEHKEVSQKKPTATAAKGNGSNHNSTTSDVTVITF